MGTVNSYNHKLRAKAYCEKCGEPASIKEFKGVQATYEATCRKCGSKNVIKFV